MTPDTSSFIEVTLASTSKTPENWSKLTRKRFINKDHIRIVQPYKSGDKIVTRIECRGKSYLVNEPWEEVMKMIRG